MTSNRRASASAKSQSAMEYLVTWGWAIAIVTVALAGLYTLGVFGGNNSAIVQRAHAGTCVITRQATGLSSIISLTGECTNMQPQFVAQFNGATSFINITNPSSFNFAASYTITAWVKLSGTDYSNSEMVIAKTASATWGTGGKEIYIWPSGTSYRYDYYGQTSLGTTTPVLEVGTWYFLATTYNSTTGTVTQYIDGAQEANAVYGAGAVPADPSGSDVYLGQIYAGTDMFGGDMSNVQFYNTTLAPEEVHGLYAEGIGGAPIRPTAIVGWWPLNGNGNDYGGLSNQGMPSNVAYTDSWDGGYNLP
jgi:hypothetical protein